MYREDTDQGAARIETVPDKIGRFTIQKELGRGGFGVVYLGHDQLADRDVAIKVPNSSKRSPAQLELFLEDARTAIQLVHPGIVRIYEVNDAPVPYVVQEYFKGGDLLHHAAKRQLSPREAVAIVIQVAEAISFAHQRGYTHLDLKPANILLREDGQACVADFGLAVHESQQWSQAGRIAGTTAYMSPEQAAGEIHRLDGRSDIWSLGVILYELLVKKRPFHEKPKERLIDEIRFRDPRPLRQHDPNLPAELGRIVQCCLEKSCLQRYQSAADLVDDLRQWLNPQEDSAPAPLPVPVPEFVPLTPVAPTPWQVIPQGLRSFEAEHAPFYLSLLPGPHDRDGLPNRVRFWKKQIEQRDADQTFSVGLMYGPSGCGKSSLVKAGLLPNLGPQVKSIYLEATAGDTEVRLIKGLRKFSPDATQDCDLPELMAWVRESNMVRQEKLLIVIDQFEQWLHSHPLDRTDQLIKALRHCDGGSVQCLVLVRDDFWMSATNFMRALDLPLSEGFNSAPVDLFDLDHARRVLRLLGQAYGKMPPPTEELSEDQSEFIEWVVDDLASSGKVVCVQLAVFAEMMKGRSWSVDELQRIGGAEGVGVSFLHETFNASNSPPVHRRHRAAIRAVLESLLPDAGLDIKGRMKSYDELKAVSGYAEQVREFDEVLGILDGDVKLLTPTEPDGIDPDSIEGRRFYQLTHDFLVPSLREWLTREKSGTWRGRAELRLAERAELWRSKKEDRQLPSVWEYILIRLCLPHSRGSDLQREMMRRADRVKGVQFLASLVVLFAVFSVTYSYWQRTEREIAAGHVESLIQNPPQVLSGFIDLLRPRKSHATPLLRKAFVEASTDRERLHAACALSELGFHDFDFPLDLITDCEPATCPSVISAFTNGPPIWRETLSAKIAAYRGEIDDREKKLAILRVEIASKVQKAEASEDESEQAGGESQDKSSSEEEGRLKELVEQLKEEEKQIHDEIRLLQKTNIRLPILALHLNLLEGAAASLRNAPDPTERTLFISTFATWHGDHRQRSTLAKFASSWPLETNCDFLSGVALSIASSPISESGAESDWLPVLKRWYAESANGGVHSASAFALRRLGVSDSDLTEMAERELALRKGVHRDWDVTSKTNLALVRIPASTVSPAFWMSDREITIALFKRFVADTEYDLWQGPTQFPEISSDEQMQHPVQSVSFVDIARFCNWLTDEEGNLSRAYRYVPNDEGKMEVEVVADATGFRIPTAGEWMYACAAGTRTKYFIGDSAEEIPNYGHVRLRTDSALTTHVVGTQLCNPWGLFDLCGNVDEWCSSGRGLGGNFSTPPDFCSAAVSISEASRVHGFRVVRSVDDER
jgi:serine/threonine protein kinase